MSIKPSLPSSVHVTRARLCSETLWNFIIFARLILIPCKLFPKCLCICSIHFCLPMHTLKKKPNLINMWPLRIHSKRFLLFISVPFFPDVPSTYLFFLFHFPPFFTLRAQRALLFMKKLPILACWWKASNSCLHLPKFNFVPSFRVLFHCQLSPKYSPVKAENTHFCTVLRLKSFN